MSRHLGEWTFAVYDDPSVRDQVTLEILERLKDVDEVAVCPYQWTAELDDRPAAHRLSRFVKERPDVTGIILTDFDAACARIPGLIGNIKMSRERIRDLGLNILFWVSPETMKRFASGEGIDFYNCRALSNSYF
ncbi:MAG TPA: hypothetical protein VN420_04035 [Candidatus Fimivivens sp.]|nr:hypothetical protein [Candidatus Fimivivens sp.]